MIKNFIKRIVFPNSYSSESYIKHLRSIGMIIGNNTIIYSPNHTFIDEQRPFLITIGENCKITRGVTILSHDYSRSVIRKAFGENIGEAKKTIIGNNVFIGNNGMILMGAEIGDNCIVAAGSVVTKHFPDNVVIGGNPARIICTLEEYYHKRKSLSIEEAKMYAKLIFERTGRIPTIKEMGNAFAWLYIPRTKENIDKYKEFFYLTGDDSKDIMDNFLSSKPIYNSYEDFINDCDF
ncbi:acyltransferase [Peribacillus frigoritolerans]|uniref:acyltransferase n=1 Tax=Peribacillus frigoritolerans TaxID=450367 RepID=UPI00399FE295